MCILVSGLMYRSASTYRTLFADEVRPRMRRLSPHLQDLNLIQSMSEYQAFYKFLEGRPTRELSDCIHKITELVCARAAHGHSPSVTARKTSQTGDTPSAEAMEAARVKNVMSEIVLTGFQLPHGMNGYNKSTKKFVRFLRGNHQPVSSDVAKQHGLKPGWFLDRDLTLYLNWNPDGYFEMSRKDSLRFNENYAPNKHMFVEISQATGVVTPSHGGDKRKSHDHTDGPTAKKPREEGLFAWFSDSNGSEGEERAAEERRARKSGAPTASPASTTGRKTEEEIEREVREELLRVSAASSARPATPWSPGNQQAPIKGDTVFITKGSGKSEKGTVVGQLGADSRMYKVEVAAADGTGVRTVKVPLESLSFSAPPAAPGQKKVKRPLVAEEAQGGGGAAAAAKKSKPRCDSAVAGSTTATREEGVGDGSDEDSLDEFFGRLDSQGQGGDAEETTATAPTPAPSAGLCPNRAADTSEEKSEAGKGAGGPEPARASGKSAQEGKVKVKVKGRASALRGRVAVGDRVTVLKGEFKGRGAVVAEAARVGDKVLPGIFRVTVGDRADCSIFMPAEFLQLLPPQTLHPTPASEGAKPINEPGGLSESAGAQGPTAAPTAPAAPAEAPQPAPVVTSVPEGESSSSTPSEAAPVATVKVRAGPDGSDGSAALEGMAEVALAPQVVGSAEAALTAEGACAGTSTAAEPSHDDADGPTAPLTEEALARTASAGREATSSPSPSPSPSLLHQQGAGQPFSSIIRTRSTSSASQQGSAAGSAAGSMAGSARSNAAKSMASRVDSVLPVGPGGATAEVPLEADSALMEPRGREPETSLLATPSLPPEEPTQAALRESALQHCAENATPAMQLQSQAFQPALQASTGPVGPVHYKQRESAITSAPQTTQTGEMPQIPAPAPAALGSASCPDSSHARTGSSPGPGPGPAGPASVTAATDVSAAPAAIAEPQSDSGENEKNEENEESGEGGGEASRGRSFSFLGMEVSEEELRQAQQWT